MKKIDKHVIHYGRYNPDVKVGGVESFARNLRLVFDKVTFMYPENLDEALIRRTNIPVICDNQNVLDISSDIPVIGFRHGVAREKVMHTKSWNTFKLAYKQYRASKRPNVTWVSCAQWIAQKSEELYGAINTEVIYHPVDLTRFKGGVDQINSKNNVILHDARTEHKGKFLLKHLAKIFPEWQFEKLGCKPEDVPQRMSEGRAFIHLSRYEGNSIVCNEAMAMDMPCFFTKVGLMRDHSAPDDIYVIEMKKAFTDFSFLETEFEKFSRSLSERQYHPRKWVMEHATPEISRDIWERVLSQQKELIAPPSN